MSRNYKTPTLTSTSESQLAFGFGASPRYRFSTEPLASLMRTARMWDICKLMRLKSRFQVSTLTVVARGLNVCPNMDLEMLHAGWHSKLHNVVPFTMLGKVPGSVLRHHFRTSAACHKSSNFTLSYTMLGSKEVETETYVTVKEFREAYAGFRFKNPKTGTTHTSVGAPTWIDPTITYLAKHPFLTTPIEEHSHSQISDKAYEDKACKALERHLLKRLAINRRVPDNPTRPNGWRFLSGAKDVAEWEGIWQCQDGRFIFLEAKHYMDLARLTFTDVLGFYLTDTCRTKRSTLITSSNEASSF
jgi:hypothetical protein